MYKRLREMTEEEVKELKDLEVVFYEKKHIRHQLMRIFM